jgi:hypothetical protein
LRGKKMTTAEARVLARTAEDRLDWSSASRLYRFAADHYPAHHSASELAQADIKSLNQKSDICEHFATRDLISSVLRRAGVPGSDNLGEIVASALSNEDIPCITHFVQGVDCSLCEESAPHSHGPLDAEHFTGNRIRTSFVNPPLPIRHFDWVAWIDGDEETGLAGNGKTEQEAIDELIALQMVYDESNANTEASQ